jgi:phospholipid/cholesterol/gamma-HCH transport system substrate-binding protein
MPGTSKTKWAQLKVGVMAVVAFVILAILIFLMTGGKSFFQQTSPVYTYFDDSAALAPAASVRLNGILVGTVTNIELSGSADPNRVVKVTMQIDNNYLPQIPVDSQTEISQETLLANKYINIKRGMSKQTIKSGSELPALNRADFNDVIAQGNTALVSLDAILKQVNGIVGDIQSGRGTLGQLLVDDTISKKVVTLLDQTQKLIVSLNTVVNSPDNSVGKLLHDNHALYDQIEGSVKGINTMVDGINQGQGTLGQLMKNRAVYDEVHQTLADARKLLADIDHGPGTVGRLIQDDAMQKQIQATLGRVDDLLDKMNSGQGTLGQLLVNPQLYQSLDGTSREMEGLLKDFRANPKKFLRIQLHIF